MRFINNYISGDNVNQHPLKLLWDITRKVSRRNVNKWAHTINKLYDGIVDDLGLGIIHPNEPTQGVFFNSNVIDIVDLIKNSRNWGGTVNRYIRTGDDLKEYIDRNETVTTLTVLLNLQILQS